MLDMLEPQKLPGDCLVFIFIQYSRPVHLPHRRVRVLKRHRNQPPLSDNQALEDLKSLSLLKRYFARPQTDEFKELLYAQFHSMYAVKKHSQLRRESLGSGVPSDEPA